MVIENEKKLTNYKNTVLIIGGSGGIGRSLSDKLKLDLNVISLSSKELDITNRKQLREFFNKNKIGVVINLAGYNFDCFLHKYNIENFNEIDKQIDIIIKGGVNILNACIPGMRSRGFGRIIYISSILVSKPVVGTAVYSASKSFLETLMKSCTIENGMKGITSNTIQLGYFDAGLTKKIPPLIQNKIKLNIPSKRWGAIEELENVVRCLIKTEYINGMTLKLTGAGEL